MNNVEPPAGDRPGRRAGICLLSAATLLALGVTVLLGDLPMEVLSYPAHTYPAPAVPPGMELGLVFRELGR